MSVDAEQAKIDKARKESEDLIAQNRAEREKREAAEAAKGKENPEKKDQGPKAPVQDKGKKDQNKGGRKPVVTNMKKKRVEEEEDEDDDEEEEERLETLDSEYMFCGMVDIINMKLQNSVALGQVRNQNFVIDTNRDLTWCPTPWVFL